MIACFSSSVKFTGSFTATFVGSFSPVSSPLSPDFLMVCDGLSVPFLPSFSTVTLPLLSTVIVASVKSGLAFLIATLIFPCSSGVTFSGSFTATFSGAFTASLLSSCLTVLSELIFPISFPALSVIVTLPSSATVTFASFGKFGFASSTAFLTFPFSSSVNAFEFATVI